MREPRVRESLSWGKKKTQTTFTKDASLVYDAVSNINKFENDGSFMHEVIHKQSSAGGPIGENIKPNLVSVDTGRPGENGGAVKDASSANQLAAKAFQLRLKGKHEEADKLLVRHTLTDFVTCISNWFMLILGRLYYLSCRKSNLM